MSGGIKIFVYGVNRSCPKETLEDKFAQFGTVSDVYITEKGYAFVTMDNEGEAKTAISQINGTTINGKQVFVSFAERQGNFASNKTERGHSAQICQEPVSDQVPDSDEIRINKSTQGRLLDWHWDLQREVESLKTERDEWRNAFYRVQERLDEYEWN